MAKNIHLETKLEQPSDDALALPFYPLLPKSKIGLLRWRVYAVAKAAVDEEFRRDLDTMCKADLCFYAATFGWLHETRDDAFTDEAGKFPFVPWVDQCDILGWLQKYGGRTDITIEKTRGIGLSWLIVIYIHWRWQYHGERLDFGIMSKDDKGLDMVGRPGTLMGKLDVWFENLPYWMKTRHGKTILKRTHTNHRFENLVNNNAILGYTATDDNLRSARLNLLVSDETAFLPVDIQRWLASSQFVTSSRIFVSTHDGTATMFYRLSTNTKAKLVRISTWWQANPARAAGMYVVKNGQVEIIDKDYKFPPDYFIENAEYVFMDPGLERSPWVDGEFAKPEADPIKLKQEIYGVAALDTKKLFQPRVMSIMENTCRPPYCRARLENDEFIEDLEGSWYFWEPLELPFESSYVIGVDPSHGTAHAALAGVCVIDVKTGATVITAALRDADAVQLARRVEVLCKFLCGPRSQGNATVAPEITGGVGGAFLTELKRLRWPSIYKDSQTQVGIHNRDKGEKVLIEAGRGVLDGDLVIMDDRIYYDLDHFEYDSKLELVFTGTVGHGDLGQAMALGWWGARNRRRAILEQENPGGEELQPIEREPGYRRPVLRKSRGWADRFSRV